MGRKNITVTKFSLYNKSYRNIESTIFDLISGDKETKQTKGLAYIMSKNTNLINKIINLSQVRKQIEIALGKNANLINFISYIHIDAEMISDDKPVKRRDITLSFYSNKVKSINKKFLVVIIEAKSIKATSINSKEIDIQLKGYMDSNSFKSDGDVAKVAITLTKDKLLENNNNRIARVTWIEIIEILKQEISLIKNDEYLKIVLEEYYRFITGVDKSMKFYEKEVLSVAAGNTSGLIEQYFIHACPANKTSYNYKDALFITFREKNGGEMGCLYKIDEIIILNPHGEEYKSILDHSSVEYGDRMKSYIEDRKSSWKFEHEGEYRFYILSKTEIINLSHKPKPKNGNNPGARYYTLVEMLSGKKEINTESNQ